MKEGEEREAIGEAAVVEAVVGRRRVAAWEKMEVRERWEATGKLEALLRGWTAGVSGYISEEWRERGEGDAAAARGEDAESRE